MPGKDQAAVSLAFQSVGNLLSDEEADRLLKNVEQKIDDRVTDEPSVSVEEIQDFVEQALMEANHYKALKSYILYREERARKRKSRKKLADKIPPLTGWL